jgi:hypothetical protein
MTNIGDQVLECRSQWPRRLRHENCLRSFECWDRVFESLSKHGCLYCVFNNNNNSNNNNVLEYIIVALIIKNLPVYHGD